MTTVFIRGPLQSIQWTTHPAANHRTTNIVSTPTTDLLVEHHRGRYHISTDPAHLDVAAIHAYLTRSYWAAGIPEDTVARSLRASLNFGLYDGDRQAGLARVVTDHATFAYLCDVYVLEEHRGQGLSKWLMEIVVAHPALTGARRVMLATRDAHSLYARFGFTAIAEPELLMQIVRRDIYRR